MTDNELKPCPVCNGATLVRGGITRCAQTEAVIVPVATEEIWDHLKPLDRARQVIKGYSAEFDGKGYQREAVTLDIAKAIEEAVLADRRLTRAADPRGDKFASSSHADDDKRAIEAAFSQSSITLENGQQRDELLREAYRMLHRWRYPDEEAEYQVSVGDLMSWLDRARAQGFEVK